MTFFSFFVSWVGSITSTPVTLTPITNYAWKSRFSDDSTHGLIYFDEDIGRWIISAVNSNDKLILTGLENFFEPITAFDSVEFKGIIYNITITCHDVNSQTHSNSPKHFFSF